MRGFSTRAAGLLIFVGGLWGGLAPFIGPYWHFTLGPDKTWTWTTGRLWLDVIPGAVAVIAGLMLMGAGPRPHARLGALLGLAAGIWFTIGPAISELWTRGGAQGIGHGSAHARMLENLTFHTGLGVLMAALAAYILPRFPARVVEREPAYAGDAAAGRGRGVGRRDAVADHEYAGRPHRGRDLAEGAAAGAAATGAVEHHREHKREREMSDDRLAGGRMTGDRTAGDGVAGDRMAADRTAGLDRQGAGEPVAERSAAPLEGERTTPANGSRTAPAGGTTDRMGADGQRGEPYGAGDQVGADTGAGAVRGGTLGAGNTGATTDAGNTGATTDAGDTGATANAGDTGATTNAGDTGGAIADRRQTVRRRRGGLLGMLTRR